MPDHERAMMAYVQLADIARRKGQQPGQVKFLALTAISALRAGWPDVAERCRDVALEVSPRHLLSHYDSMAEALRDPDFDPFARRMNRFCTYERAESLLEGLGLPVVPKIADDDTLGFYALRLLEASGSATPTSSDPEPVEDAGDDSDS